MEDRWTTYIREKAKKRNIANPWLKDQNPGNETTAPPRETEKAS